LAGAYSLQLFLAGFQFVMAGAFGICSGIVVASKLLATLDTS
jgi:hypothetical protein